MMKPVWSPTAYLKGRLEKFSQFRLLPGNVRLVPMSTDPDTPGQVLAVLDKARTGEGNVSDDIAAALKEGSLWG